MTASVVVPSFRRPEALARCLDGLRAQRRAPDEILVVVHVSDELTPPTLGGDVRMVLVEDAGLVAALNGGLQATTGDFVALIDDDAIPAPDWLERILIHFASDARVAGVGGRDVVHEDGRILGRENRGLLARWPGAPPVGRIQWFGRHIGNHHIGEGPARDVDVLKGANMAFRRAAVAGHGFDGRLLGHGAQPHSELSICLPLRRRGLRLIYDPAVIVDHFPAPRPAGDDRRDQAHRAIFDWTYNETLQILDHLERPLQRTAFRVWSVGVGTRSAPGLLNVARGGRASWPRFVAAGEARAAALRTHRTTPRQVR